MLPTVVAGLNGIGRGQVKQALMEFVGTVAQTMGPEAMQSLLNPTEILKRLAAASGIEVLGLVKTDEQMAQEQQQAEQKQMQAQLMSQAGQLAKSPVGEEMTKQFIGNDGPTQAPPSPEG